MGRNPTLSDAPRQAPAQAVEAAVSRKVIPLGKAVGIKLFSDGVLVVGLSPVETEAGVAQRPEHAAGGVIEGHGADARHGVPEPHPQLIDALAVFHRRHRQLELP